MFLTCFSSSAGHVGKEEVEMKLVLQFSADEACYKPQIDPNNRVIRTTQGLGLLLTKSFINQID